MKNIFAVLLAGVLVLSATAAFAHEGHEHKLMGTVSAVRGTSLELKTTDGKLTTITVNAKTLIVRGTSPVKLENLKTGERAVVTAVETKQKSGGTVMVAKEVRVAASAGSPSPEHETIAGS